LHHLKGKIAYELTFRLMAHKILVHEERKIIEKELLRKTSCRDIAALLGRDHSVISREIKLNSGEHMPYSADRAQLYADRRKTGKRKRMLEENGALRDMVIEKLRDEWSPDQIDGWLREECEKPPGFVSYETIYKYVYSPEGKEGKLWLHLRTGRRKRRIQGVRKSRCDQIPDRTSIHERPEWIGAKERYGDWESDSVDSPRTGKGGLSSHYERKSQTCRIHKLQSKRSEDTKEALVKTKDSLPDYLFLTVTFDNGSENVRHAELKKEFGIETYFCDPYCSWQKGGVENLNKLIRQYFPKKTDFSRVSEEAIYAVQEKLNNRPRKSLNYRSPNQVISELVGGGATNP